MHGVPDDMATDIFRTDLLHWYSGVFFVSGLEVVRIEVEDMTPPTLPQVHQFIEIVDKAKYDKTVTRQAL